MGLPNEIHPFHLAGAGAGYQVPNSLRFRASNTANMARTPSVAGNRKTWTWSYWIKRGTLSSVQLMLVAYSGASDSGNFDVRFNASDQLLIYGWTSLWRQTTQVFRDPTAWYHILINADTTSATGADRVKLYINGSRVTTFASSTDPTQNSDLAVGSVGIHRISGNSIPDGLYFDGYMAEMYMVDGFAYDPSYFGQIDSITGQWVPKKYSGSYGTNGFYLPFNDATSTTTLGYDRQLSMSDSSKNNWTLNNFTVNSPANTATSTHDVYIDTPTSYNDGSITYNHGNYPTINPLVLGGGTYLADGNMRVTGSGAGDGHLSSMVIPTTGKWFFEAYPTAYNASYIAGWFGVSGITGANFSGLLSRVGVSPGGYYQNDSNIASGYYGGINIMYGMAVDRDANTITIYMDGVAQSTAVPTLATGIDLFFYTATYTGGAMFVNYGQRPFRYPVAGFKALNSYNLPNPSLPLV